MTTEIVQVRDVPATDVEVLRARASSRGLSLSGYLRELIHAEASRPALDEVLARISARDHVDSSSEQVRSFIEDGRRP